MSRPTTAIPQQQVAADEGPPSFVTPEGLRALLVRLHRAGAGSWRNDVEASELMTYVIDRYAGLARKHHVEPEDAASAAFEAMQAASLRQADDPWAVLTTAVQISLIAQERADGLLTSVDRARRADVSAFHDCMRFSDREHDLLEYHPAFQTYDDPTEVDADGSPAPSGMVGPDERAAGLLVALGWPIDTARMVVDYICSRLVDAGDRQSAYEWLRKDKYGRAILDLSHQAWIGLLRFLLGHPTSPRLYLRMGALARLLLGDSTEDLLHDTELVHFATPARTYASTRARP